MSDTRTQYEEMLETAKNEGDSYKQSFAESKLAELDQQRQQAENQKHEELQEVVLGYNLNEVLGHPDANKLVHTMLFEQGKKHLDELEKKDQIIAGMNEAARAAEANWIDEADRKDADIAELTTKVAKLTSDLEDVQKEERYYRNEAARLTTKVTELDQRLQAEKDQRSQLTPSQNLTELIQNAKAVTEQRRPKITNVEPVDFKRSAFKATGEDGKEIIIPYLNLPMYQQVESLPPQETAPEPVTDEAIDQQHQVLEEAYDEAQRFQNEQLVSGDAAGSEVHAGEEEVLQDAGGSEQTEVPTLEERFVRLNRRVTFIEERLNIATPAQMDDFVAGVTAHMNQ